MVIISGLIWLLAGVGIFIVGMNFLSDALEKSAGSGLKKFLGKISNNRFSGVGVGAGVTAIIQSSSATSVMVIGLVNAGVLTLIQAVPIIMGANIGTTITGVLVSLKNDYFNMAMYLLAFAGVMMSFVKREKVKLIGSLFTGLGLIFIGLNIMSSDAAFGNPEVKDLFIDIFKNIDFPLLLILVGVVFTALIQSSSAATGVVITMVGTNVMPLETALFIVLGANIGTCVTALLASLNANTNSKRVAFIHFIFNFIGTMLFTVILWIFGDQIINILEIISPGDINDPIAMQMAMQMRVSIFHVVFNVSTTLILLAFVKQLVQLSKFVIRDKEIVETKPQFAFKFVDDRLLTMPTVALGQVKKEIDYMLSLVKTNTDVSYNSLISNADSNSGIIEENEKRINFINSALTKYLINLSSVIKGHDEQIVGTYFHVLNDLERIGDHAENFHEIGVEMAIKGLAFSDQAMEEIKSMENKINQMFEIVVDAFENLNPDNLPRLTELENEVDECKKQLTANHFARLAEGNCNMALSPYYSSLVLGLERVADHLVNVGYSILNPTGSQSESRKNN